MWKQLHIGCRQCVGPVVPSTHSWSCTSLLDYSVTSKSKTYSSVTAPEHEMPMYVLKPIIIGNTEEEKGDFQFDIVLCGKPIKAGLVPHKGMTSTLMDIQQLTSPPRSLSSSVLPTCCCARPALTFLQPDCLNSVCFSHNQLMIQN